MKNDNAGFDKFFNFFDKHFIKIFIAILVVIVIWWAAIGFLAVKIVGDVKQVGLKTFIEQIWEGPK